MMTSFLFFSTPRFLSGADGQGRAFLIPVHRTISKKITCH